MTAFPSGGFTCFPGAALQTRRDSPYVYSLSWRGKLLFLIMPSLPQWRVRLRVIIKYMVFLLTCCSLWTSERRHVSCKVPVTMSALCLFVHVAFPPR